MAKATFGPTEEINGAIITIPEHPNRDTQIVIIEKRATKNQQSFITVLSHIVYVPINQQPATKKNRTRKVQAASVTNDQQSGFSFNLKIRSVILFCFQLDSLSPI